MNKGAFSMYLYHSCLIDERGAIEQVGELKMKERIESFGDLLLDGVIKQIEFEQERYCNLGNGGSVDYNDFIDCLENLKRNLEDNFIS